MKYLMTLMLSALLVSTATAQQKSDATPALQSRAEMMTERMTKELGLNADQVAKVKTITLKYDRKAKGRASAKANAVIAPDKAGALTEMNESLKNVLTPAQAKQWKKIQAEVYSTEESTQPMK